jgi:DNA recombination protein RmuC
MSSFIPNLLFLLTGLFASGIWGFYAVRQAHRRGRREAELEAAPLRDKALDLETRLRASETRLENERRSLQEAMSQKSALEEKCEHIPRLQEELNLLKGRAEYSAGELLEISRNNARLQTELQELRNRAPEMRETLHLELAKFLDDKGEAFSKHSLGSLDNLLTPLGNKLKEFEQKVESTYQQERDQHTQLKTQIELLYQMNQNLGQEAKSLTQALKGENKTGGNWGEVILERVLEFSGLEKGQGYTLQMSLKNDEGKTKIPDAVIHLPNKHSLVIDSKLSLVAYERYCSAKSPEESETELDLHVQSVRQHVKDLSSQRYQDLPGLKTVDFVFLFMPIEPAFIEAVKSDHSLFQEAWDKHIIIVSPSTLLATLRSVANIWKQEDRGRNASEIARQAGALYDKFVGFLVDLDGLGKSLNTAQKSFEEAKKKLKDGQGNLIKRAENLKKLGAKTKDSTPESWLDALEEESEIPENLDNRLLE